MKPMQALCDKMDHFLLYFVELSIDPRKEYKAFGCQMVVELSDLRFHFVLPGILDINLVHGVLLRSVLQPVASRTWGNLVGPIRRELNLAILGHLGLMLGLCGRVISELCFVGNPTKCVGPRFGSSLTHGGTFDVYPSRLLA